MPNACIGADVIVGFPGETDELFFETYKFIQSLNISYDQIYSLFDQGHLQQYFLIRLMNKLKAQGYKRCKIY